jgi:hypothetical protein
MKGKKGKGGNEIMYIAIGVAVGYFGKPHIDKIISQVKGAIPS